MTMPPFPSVGSLAPAPAPAPDLTFTPQAFQRGQADLYGLASPTAQTPISEAPGPHKFQILGQRKVKGRGTIYYWQYTKYTSQGGLNKTRGFADRDHARLKSSTLWTMDAERLILPPLPTKQGIAQTDLTMMPWTYIFGQLVVGFGGNSAGTGELHKEVAAGNPIMSAWLTGFNGAATFLGSIAINSALPRLAVCRVGNSPIIYNDLVPSATHLMNADLLGCSGFIETTVQQTPGANMILFACPTSIRTKLSTDTEISVSQPALTGLSSLTYPIGLLQWSGRIRAFWGSPAVGAIHPPLDLNATVDEKWVRIVHTNQQGQDPDEAQLPTMDRPRQVIMYNNGLVGHDETRIVWKTTYPRGAWRDFRIQRDLDPHSDRQRVIRDIGVASGVFIALVDELILAGAGTPTRYYMAYDFDQDTWHAISPATTLGAGNKSVAGVGGIPYSLGSQQVHGGTNDGNLHYQFLPPWGMSWYSYRQIESDHVGQNAQQTGTATWPEYILPSPMEYGLSVTDAIWYGGEIGPDGSQVQITAGGVTATFKGPLSAASRYYPFPQNHGAWGPTLPDLAITMTRSSSGADVTKNMNAYPFTIWAHTFVPDRAIDPTDWWPDALSVAP